VLESAIETLTDTELEYSSVNFLLNSIEMMLIDLEMMVNCILAQQINAFMIPSFVASNLALDSLGAVQLSGKVAKDGYSAIIKIIRSAVFTRKIIASAIAEKYVGKANR
jgi:hypothetical protein